MINKYRLGAARRGQVSHLVMAEPVRILKITDTITIIIFIMTIKDAIIIIVIIIYMIPKTVPVGVFVHVDPCPGHGDHGEQEDEHDDGDEEADGHAAPGPVLPNTPHPPH